MKIIILLLAIAVFAESITIGVQQQYIFSLKSEIDKIITDQVRNQKNDDVLYKYMIKHEASIRLLQNAH